MISRFVLISIWVLFSSSHLIANNNVIDSLLSRLPQTVEEEKAATYLELSEAHRLTDLAVCIKYGDSAVHLAEKLDENALRAKALKSIGISCYYNGEFDLALEYYNQSLEDYRLLNDLTGVAKCLNNIGVVYEELGNYELSIDYYERSGEIGKQMNDQKWVSFVLLNLGNSHFYRGNLRQAINNYYHALLIFTDMDDKNSIGEACNNIGTVYSAWGEYEKALEYFERAREIYFITGDERNLSKVLSNMAEMYNYEQKDYIKAKQLYEQSLEIKIRLNDLMGIAMQNHNLGTLYANMEEYDKAQKYFEISENLYREMESKTGLVMVYYSKGKFYEKQSNPKNALTYFKRSLQIANEIGQKDYVLDNYKALFKCYAALGDYINFNKYYKMFEIGNDTLLENLHRAEMLEMEARFKVDQVVNESMTLAKENQTMKNEVKKYRLLTFGFAGIIIFSLVFYFLYIIFRS